MGVSQLHAAGHLLYRSFDTNTKNRLCLNLDSLMNSNWISWFVFSVGGEKLTSVIGSCGLMLLPVFLQGIQSLHFCWISLLIRGHQNGLAACYILLIEGCPL